MSATRAQRAHTCRCGGTKQKLMICAGHQSFQLLTTVFAQSFLVAPVAATRQVSICSHSVGNLPFLALAVHSDG